MSFILDALRKSEHERQRQSGPALVEVAATAPKPRSNPWASVALALLLVNLVAIGIFLLVRSGAVPPAEPTVQSAPPAPTVIAQSPPTTPSPRLPPPMLRPAEPAAPATRNPLAEEVTDYSPGMEYEAAERAAAPPPGPPAVVASPRRGGTVVYESMPDPGALTAAGSPRPAGSASRNMPTADEVAASSGLPELRLELHVYSNRPQERFVFINGAKYREGETTPEGAAVEQITAEGVIMSARGNRFLLPRD
jgi:general secretion pathway protein B